MPPGKFLKIDVLRLNLGAFQSHNHAILHGHLKAIAIHRFMDLAMHAISCSITG